MSVTVSSLTMQLSMVSLPTLGHSQSQFGSNRMPYPGTIFHRTKLGHPLMAKHKLCLRFLPKWSHRWMHAYGAKANQVFLNPEREVHCGNQSRAHEFQMQFMGESFQHTCSTGQLRRLQSYVQLVRTPLELGPLCGQRSVGRVVFRGAQSMACPYTRYPW